MFNTAKNVSVCTSIVPSWRCPAADSGWNKSVKTTKVGNSPANFPMAKWEKWKVRKEQQGIEKRPSVMLVRSPTGAASGATGASLGAPNPTHLPTPPHLRITCAMANAPWRPTEKNLFFLQPPRRRMKVCVCVARVKTRNKHTHTHKTTPRSILIYMFWRVCVCVFFKVKGDELTSEMDDQPSP